MKQLFILLSFAQLAIASFAFPAKNGSETSVDSRAKDSEYTVLQEDKIPWEFERKQRLIVIGDIHGDVDALLSILTQSKLIKQIGDEIVWIGGKGVQIVLMGDVVAKGSHSSNVLNLLIHLETLMLRESSELHLILGNHEARALQGDFLKFSLKDIEHLEKMGPLDELFSAQGIYGKWLANKNSIIKIGDYVFCHRGLGDWIHDFNPGEINSTVRAWIRYWMSGKKKPEASSGWVVGSTQTKIPAHYGPMDSPALSPLESSTKHEGMMSLTSLRKALGKLNAKKIFIGHYANPDEVGPHPLYGSLAWLTDSGISKAIKDGKILYLDLSLDEEPKEFIEVSRVEEHSIRSSGCLKQLRISLKGS